MLNKVVKSAGYFFICAGYSLSVKKKKGERKHKEKSKVLNLLKPRMKCLILWSNDKEKKMQQNKNRKYCSVLYFRTLLSDFHEM